MKKQFVKDLAVRNKVNDIFYIRSRRQLEKRDGGKFLVLDLSDKTGTIEGKIWDNVNDLFSDSNPGNFIKVEGDVTEYIGDLQITVSHIFKVSDKEVSSKDFLPVSRFDIEEMYKELLSYFDMVKDKDYRKLLDTLFSNPEFVTKFKSAPASTGIHHGYLGGLLEHTLFMLRLSRSAPNVYPEIDYSLLVTGLILHDIGKITSYTYDKVIDHTDEGHLIGHIVRGYEIAKNIINKIPDFPAAKKELVLHIILSHHGIREYGSPVTPKFAEAFMVHDLDNLDARMMMFRDETEKNRDAKWSDYHQFLETRVFIKPPATD
jgi:3'-5' exoribonuclease